ncbi:MAG: carbohydrate binding domain-containing protein [Phycisphaerales bacterium]
MRHSLIPHRRGSAYLLILMTSMIVTVIGLSALLVMRVQLRAAGDTNNSAQARLCARSGIEMGLLWIQQDPNWRTTQGNGLWADNVPMGSGTFSLEALDPVDNDITDAPDDPVILTATGIKDQSRHKLQVTLEPRNGLGAVEVSLHAGNTITMLDVTLNSNQTISANNDIDGQGSTEIYANAQAANIVKGGTYFGSVVSDVPVREMPDPATALDYYIANGTPINYNDLFIGGVNLLTNPGFESGTTDWYPFDSGCDIAVDSSKPKTGSFSLLVSNRAAPWAGPAQDITSQIVSGTTYHVQVHAQRVNVNVDGIKITVRVEYKETPLALPKFSYWSTAPQTAGSKWERLQGDFTLSWVGALQSAVMYVETDTSLESFRIDDAVLIELGLTSDRRMRHTVLSPTSNPFGTGVTNPQGIYVLDCLGKTVFIEDCRIVGTLVIINPGSVSAVQGSVSWESAVANYPALLVDKEIIIGIGTTGLSESSLNENFNPPGTPYPYPLGSENLDVLDAYPSMIKGLVYSATKIIFQNHPIIDGVVVSEGDILVGSSDLDLRYRPIYLEQPPPGFGGTKPRMVLATGSWKRVVD